MDPAAIDNHGCRVRQASTSILEKINRYVETCRCLSRTCPGNRHPDGRHHRRSPSPPGNGPQRPPPGACEQDQDSKFSDSSMSTEDRKFRPRQRPGGAVHDTFEASGQGKCLASPDDSHCATACSPTDRRGRKSHILVLPRLRSVSTSMTARRHDRRLVHERAAYARIDRGFLYQGVGQLHPGTRNRDLDPS